MRYPFAFLTLLAISASAPAPAQPYPGQDVTVNMGATGTNVLLYPGGQYGRVVRPLLQPGEPSGPIKLHRPRKHQARREVPQPQDTAVEAPPVHKRLARAEPLSSETHPAPAPAPVKTPVKAAPKPVAKAPAPAPARSMPDLGDFQVLKPAPPKQEPKPAPVRKAEPAKSQQVARAEPPMVRTAPSVTPHKAEPPAPQQIARIEPPARKSAPENFGARRGVVAFEPNASDPNGSALQTVGKLAEELNASLVTGGARVQILAYAGPKGLKSSDSRRLSLKRALIIRQLLIDAGVPSERIDVRAMGGADDNGRADRVDIFLKA